MHQGEERRFPLKSDRFDSLPGVQEKALGMVHPRGHDRSVQGARQFT